MQVQKCMLNTEVLQRPHGWRDNLNLLYAEIYDAMGLSLSGDKINIVLQILHLK
jgi:hypothetical protein